MTARPGPVRVAMGLVAGALVAGCAAGGADGSGSAGASSAGTSASSPSAEPGPASAGLRAAAGLARCPPAPAGAARPPAGSLPAITLPCLGDGPAVAMSGLRGPAVVNLWAAWCAPCRTEMPALQALHAKAGHRLLVLGVVTDDDRRDALSAARALGVRYPSVLDEAGTLRRRLGYPGPPVTLVVDRTGRVVARRVGPVPSAAALSTLVAERLGVRL